MKRTYSFAFIFLRIIIFVRANGFYTVVSPGTIQSHTDFSVSVSVHENSEPVTFKLAVQGLSYNETKEAVVSPSQTQVVNFNVPHLKSGLYKLNVNGVKGLVFENSTNLVYKSREPQIYIQTDKSIYKPGDLIQYRIIVLDEEVRPVKLNQPLKLSLRDGAGNIVYQMNDIILNKGVFSGDFPLSQEPNLGDWMMEVTLSSTEEDTTTAKIFEVAKYVLPKYSLDIETESAICYEDPVKITLRAKYTHGKPVKGKAVVKIETNYGKSKAEKVIDVDGKGHVEFDLAKDLNLVKPEQNAERGIFSIPRAPPINIIAEMTEDLTGNKLDKQSSVSVHYSRYYIEEVPGVKDYFTDLPFELKIYVKTFDGSPVQDKQSMAKLIIDKWDRFNSPDQPLDGQFIFSSEIDNNGMAVFKVVLPTAKRFTSVKFVYKDAFLERTELNGLDKELMPAESFTLVRTTEGLALDQDIVVQVQAQQPIPYYVYALVARGNIIKQEHVILPANVQTHEIKFKSSFTMVPKAYLYVYLVQQGELRFKEMTFDFPKEFQNKIEITAPMEAKPGEEVALTIKTDPDSFVGLLGVDQSVLLLKSGNDLNYNKIMEDLDSHKTITPHVRGYGMYPGKISGLVTLTNANYPFTLNYRRVFPIYHRPIYLRYGIPSQPMEVLQYTSPDKYTSLLDYHDTKIASVEPIIRKEFIECWLFNNLNNTGLATFTKKIPDTITSWVITGFSVNEKSGFGMVKNPTNIKVFQPFFLSTNLPYSVKRGEVISIGIVLFNYMEKNLDAEVTMENDDGEYDFTEVSNEIEELVLTEKQRVKRVSVASNSGASLSFMIRPNKVGDITLKIKATSPLAGDAIHKTLKVEPEGVTQHKNEAMFITPPSKETLKADIPSNVVLDSEYLEFSVVGDILGPTIENIEKLMRKPSGCGEQNMVNFVPSILILRYLDAIQQDMPDVVKKATKFMEIGYQRELIYKHENGAYSAFGEKLSSPNSWLTAYVVRSFIQAQKYISIDQNVIDDALKYLLSNQYETGQFNKTGRLFYPAHQNDVGFTAFVLLSLLEDPNHAQKYSAEINKAVNYLANNIDAESDKYALALSMLALRKAQHESANKLMAKLETLAQEGNGQKWWTQSLNPSHHNNNVEITAYILEAYVYTEPTEKLLPIIKWLLANRNNLGGYDSTQNTVVGLQALGQFAKKFVSSRGNGKTTINFKAHDISGAEITSGSFSVDKDNTLVVQSHVLPKASRQVTFQAEGAGSSLVSLSYRYNLATNDDKPSFAIEHTVLETGNKHLLKINVCADYMPGADTDNKESNMAIMEIYLPSGFTADKDELSKLNENKRIQRTDTKNADTAIIVYFDYIAAGKKECFVVSADKSHAVAKQKPAAITVYDYYNSDQRATVYYEVKSSLCDICEADDCGKGCA